MTGGLVGALQATSLASGGHEATPQRRQADACILIWMDGGPSHYETFDPKPEAPAEIRGEFGTIETKTPGMRFSEILPKLASVSESLAIIRSIRHDQGNHGAGNHYMMTGAPPRIPVGCGAFVSFHPSLGSVVSHQMGAPHGIPAYFSIPNMSRSGGPNFLGSQFAFARRLVSAGVPFVTLYHGGWDHHADLFQSFKSKVPPFEATIAALIEDLRDQGMLERTMVIAMGEFGRTPKINARGGRDHWSNAMSVLFAGGGTPGGQVIGATDRQGYAATERILSPENFVSTVYRKLGIDPAQILYTPQGRPTHLVSDKTAIAELMG